MKKLFDIFQCCINTLIPVMFASYPTSAEIWIKARYKNLIPEYKWLEHWHSGIWGRLVQRRETRYFCTPLPVLVPKDFFPLGVSYMAACFLKAGYGSCRGLGFFSCLYLFSSDLVHSPFSMILLDISKHSFDTSSPGSLSVLNSLVVLRLLAGYSS